jgi:ubiquinone/menaquinone biosynthesis C-methylase UbiE
MSDLANELYERYQNLALTRDHKKTAQDTQLRELEIDFALNYVKDSNSLLDIGCGIGYTTRKYAEVTAGKVIGLDYSENMIQIAQELSKDTNFGKGESNSFDVGSVLATKYGNGEFDLITSHRCLMALLNWDLQKEAFLELHRILKPGGKLILFEGTFQGIEALNKMRTDFGLDSIDPSGKDSLFTLKFDEISLEEFITPHFDLEKKEGFGTYYFLTRIFYPLHIAPEAPKFDSSYNETAKKIATLHPNLVDLGHLKAYVLAKK